MLELNISMKSYAFSKELFSACLFSSNSSEDRNLFGGMDCSGAENRDEDKEKSAETSDSDSASVLAEKKNKYNRK